MICLNLNFGVVLLNVDLMKMRLNTTGTEQSVVSQFIDLFIYLKSLTSYKHCDTFNYARGDGHDFSLLMVVILFLLNFFAYHIVQSIKQKSEWDKRVSVCLSECVVCLNTVCVSVCVCVPGAG